MMAFPANTLSQSGRASLLAGLQTEKGASESATGNDQSNVPELLSPDSAGGTEARRVEVLYALWELEAGAWRYLYEQVRELLSEANYHRFPDEDWTEAPDQGNGFHKGRAGAAAVEFLGNYRAWSRYARDDVGTSLSEFLLRPLDRSRAREHIARIEQTAKVIREEQETDDAPIECSPVGDTGGQPPTAGEEKRTVAELAEWKYRQIRSGHESESR